MHARWKVHKGKAFLRQLTAQRVHTFLQKETAVSTRFWTEDLSRVRRTWWPLHYRKLQPGLSLSFPSHASWNANQTTDCVALFNLQIPSIFSSKLKKNPQDFHCCINYSFSDGLRPSWPANKKKFQCSAGILKTFIFASTTALATVFVPLGRKAFVVLSSSSTES